MLSALCCAGVLSGQFAVARFEMPLLSLVTCTLAVFFPLTLLLALRPQILGDQAAAMVLRFCPGLESFLRRAMPAPLPENLREQIL